MSSAGVISGRIAVFCFSSSGELDVILPMIAIHGVTDFTIVTFKREIAAKVAQDGFYSRLTAGRLQDRSIARVSANKAWRWLQFIANSMRAFWRFRNHDLFLFEYGMAGREKNILGALLICTGRAAKMIFYPHGHAVNPESDYAEGNWPPITRHAVKRGARIVKLNGITPDRRFLSVAYPILHPRWRAQIERSVPQLFQNHVVILSRDVSPYYLLAEHRAQMLADTVELLARCFPDAPIVLKAHPRETFATASLDIGGSKVIVTYENTYSVVRGAKLAVSFWTSAFFQCLALGVPVIEYHIPHERFRGFFPHGSLNAAFIPCFERREKFAAYVAEFCESRKPVAR